MGGYGLLCLGEGDMLGEASDELTAHYRCGHIGLTGKNWMMMIANL